MTPAEARVVRLFFGLGKSRREWTQSQIAAKCRISLSSVKRIVGAFRHMVRQTKEIRKIGEYSGCKWDED
jgi:hypothetical protein